MSALQAFFDWLDNKDGVAAAAKIRANPSAEPAVPVGWLPGPRPGVLVTDAPTLQTPISRLPVSTFFDLATPPNYARVGVPQTGAGGGGSQAQNVVRQFIQAVQQAVAPSPGPTPTASAPPPQVQAPPSYTSPSPTYTYRVADIIPSDPVYYGPPAIDAEAAATMPHYDLTAPPGSVYYPPVFDGVGY